MKLKILALIVALSASGLTALAADAESPQSENAILEALFFAVYPDLTSHKDVVTTAGLALVTEGFKAQTKSEMFAAMATRARTLIQTAKRDPAAAPTIDATEFTAQQTAARAEAQRLFPQVAVANSPLDRRVRKERATIERVYPDYFKNPQWPLLLTQGCAAAIMFEGQEKLAKQQAQAAQSTMSMDQAKQALEVLQMLQDLKGSRSGTSRRRQQTPAEADAWWQQYQQQQKLQQMQSDIDTLRQQQRR